MDATDIVYITTEVLVGIITIVGNGLVLAAIVKTRPLHTIPNMFVGNLAIADIAVGVLVAPCAALSFMGLPHNFYGCVFINSLILMFTNVSILMLLSVAIERFLAIKEPFLYHRLLTVRRAIMINLFVWVLGSILGLMPMYGWHGGYRDVEYCRFTDMVTYQYMVYFQFFGLVLLPLFIMLCIYIYIFIIVRRHLRQTSALHTRFQHATHTRDGFNKDVRAAKMFALVILMFGVFWFPVNIFNCVSLFCASDCYFPKQALLAAIVMSHANSSINPFLYATNNSRIRGAIKGLFGMVLNPDERSSTEHHIHHAANGSPPARDINIASIFKADIGNNYKDDVHTFANSHDEFLPTAAKTLEELGDCPQTEQNQIIVNNLDHSEITNESGRDVLSHNQIYSNSPPASRMTISQTAWADTHYETHSLQPQTPPHIRQQYAKTNLLMYSRRVTRLPDIAPLTGLSDINSDNIDTYCSNLATGDGVHVIQGETTVSKQTHAAMETEHINVSNTQQGMNNKTDPWPLEPVDTLHVLNDIDHETATIHAGYNQETRDHLPVIDIHDINSSSKWNDGIMLGFHGTASNQTTLSSLSSRRTISSEDIELPDFTQKDSTENHHRHGEINTDHNLKSNPTFITSILVDNYGPVRNAKTEQTKL